MSKRHRCCLCGLLDDESKMNRYPFNRKWFHDPSCPPKVDLMDALKKSLEKSRLQKEQE